MTMHADKPPWLGRLRKRVDWRLREAALPTRLLIRVSNRSDAQWVDDISYEEPSAEIRADQRPYRLASITKVYVAAALHRLAEEGRLRLDTSLVAAISPETAGTLAAVGYALDRITVDQVMRHLSGLRDHCSSQPFLDALRQAPEHRWTRQEQIAIAARLGPPLAPPGSQFVYSDTGYVILGEVVEQACGRPLDVALADLLAFNRLGLRRTAFDDGARRDLIPHYLDGVDARAFHASFDLFGGGGLVSTMEEVDVFLRALLGGDIFAQPLTLQALFASPLTPSDHSSYGHNGLMFRATLSGQDVWAHTGFWGNQAAFFPDSGVVLIASFGHAPRPGAYDKDALLEDVAAIIGEMGDRR